MNGKDIDSKAIFDEQISYYRPGEKVKLTILRNGKEMEEYITLINREGNTAITKKESVTSNTLGAEFEMISKIETEKYNVKSGVRIFNIRNGRIKSMGIPEGFIITSFNKKEYTNPTDLLKDLEKARGQILIEGLYSNGSRGFYSFYSY